MVAEAYFPGWKATVDGRPAPVLRADGAFVLSVKDLPDDATTAAYFEALGSSLGRTQDVDMPGANAFVTADGSVVVQKDHAVLTVDVSGLPAQFGRPPVTPPNAALLAATAILSCWTGV